MVMEGCFQMFFLLLSTHLLNGKRLWKKEDMIIGYDFEDWHELRNILHGYEDVTIVDSLSKHRRKSLLWIWSINSYLMINLTAQIDRLKTPHRLCGVHFWIHQKLPVDSHLRVTYHSEKGDKFSFRVSLLFKNWRAVSRTLAIVKHKIFKGLTKISFEVEDNHPFIKFGIINLDLLRVSTRCVGWTYDAINPPQILLPLGERNEIGGIEDLNGVYEVNHYWQNMYKWQQIDLYHTNSINKVDALSEVENNWTKHLKAIERRVDNWYFPSDKSNDSLDDISQAKLHSLFYCELKGTSSSKKFAEWQKREKYGNYPYLRTGIFKSKDFDHEVCVTTAYEKYKELGKSESWPPLFPSRDVFPYGDPNWSGMKFNEINHRILFPLALEHFISRRRGEREHSIKMGLKTRHKMIEILRKELRGGRKLVKEVKYAKNIKKALLVIDSKRIKRINKLFGHLQKEGWEDGSGVGNTDHLINLNSGFTHALFLLRNDLGEKKIGLLNTARWYNEIGELHQLRFPHKGSTADKIRNLMMSRLLIILASPMGSTKEIRQKLSDAKMLRRWIENALEINEGYGGLIKPDYTGYHHKGPYMSAYTPSALHALALASYFLHSTPFEISKKYLLNLKEALKTIYVMSHAHAIPYSVSGAKVSYSNTKLNSVFPAYAYLAIALGDQEGQIDEDMARIFLKLYKKDDKYLQPTLYDGKPSRGCQYLNAVGSIAVFEKVYKLAVANGYKEDKSPNGHWVKNFASLSIHRRKDWVVTVKGFSKYVWDYESSVDQNVYGRYQSHGHMSIANGRESLEDAHDIFSGYDWNRVSGTTSVELKLGELKSQENCRYFSKLSTVGGLHFGKGKSRNGIFIMDFEQPRYVDAFYQLKPFEFKFKKSFFFFNRMIICLGSSITKTGLPSRNVITTVFQNKLVGSAYIHRDGREYNRSSRENVSIIQNEPMIFLDSNNNGYFIPAKKGHKINMKIGKNKDPRKPNGSKVKTPKTYASVSFEHGGEPSSGSYEYVALVDSGIKRLIEFKNIMSNASNIYKPYTVMQQDNNAHVIRFRSNTAIHTGYTIFDSNRFIGNTHEHIIRKVNRPCVVMVKETAKHVTINVMDPDLRMFDEYISNSRYIQRNLLYNSYSKKAWTTISLNKKLKLIGRRNSDSQLKASIVASDNTVRLLLSHGLTSEMKFRMTSRG